MRVYAEAARPGEEQCCVDRDVNEDEFYMRISEEGGVVHEEERRQQIDENDECCRARCEAEDDEE